MFKFKQCPKCLGMIDSLSCNVCGVQDVLKLDERIVKQEVYNGYFISTVHTVINHSWTENENLWFETMIFEGKELSPKTKNGKSFNFNIEDSVYVERCELRSEAVTQHEEAKMIVGKQFGEPHELQFVVGEEK